MNNLYQFDVQLEPDGSGGFVYKAELVGAGPEVPYGYGDTPFEAIIDLCEATQEREAE